MTTAFDEDQFASKMHFNLDCDSDSDKSDFDEWYYNNKPPPLYIHDNVCNIVNIEPFTTVSRPYRAHASLSSVLCASVNDNDNSVQSAKKTKKKKVGKAVAASAAKVNKSKVSSATSKAIGNLQSGKSFHDPKLKEFTDYRENIPALHSKKKLAPTKNAKSFSLSLIEWPALDRHSSTKPGEIKDNFWRQEQNIASISSSNGVTVQKNKSKKHNISTHKTVGSNKGRGDQDFGLSTFNEIPNTIKGNSRIPLNSLVTGGRDFFLLDTILFSQRSFSIYAKPHLAMSHVFLHFYTGDFIHYLNVKSMILDRAQINIANARDREWNF